jgi:hypothetical protein
MVAPAGARAGGGDLGGRSDHYRQQQQQPRRARPDSGSSVSVPTSSAPAIPLQRKETRLVSGDNNSRDSLSWAVNIDLIRASGVDLQSFLPRSDSVFGDAMAAMLAPHDR